MTALRPVEIAFPQLDGTTGSILFDAVLREVHSASATVSEHAVDSGANVADHVRPELDRLSLEFVVSNTPVRQPDTHMDGAQGRRRSTEDGASVLQFDGPFDRRKAVYDELRRIERDGVVCRILTEIREYPNMVLRGLEVPRDVDTSHSLHGTVEAVQVRLVDAATVAAAPVPREPRGRGRRNRGTQATEPSDEAASGRTRSALAVITDALGG